MIDYKSNTTNLIAYLVATFLSAISGGLIIIFALEGASSENSISTILLVILEIYALYIMPGLAIAGMRWIIRRLAKEKEKEKEEELRVFINTLWVSTYVSSILFCNGFLSESEVPLWLRYNAALAANFAPAILSAFFFYQKTRRPVVIATSRYTSKDLKGWAYIALLLAFLSSLSSISTAITNLSLDDIGFGIFEVSVAVLYLICIVWMMNIRIGGFYLYMAHAILAGVVIIGYNGDFLIAAGSALTSIAMAFWVLQFKIGDISIWDAMRANNEIDKPKKKRKVLTNNTEISGKIDRYAKLYNSLNPENFAHPDTQDKMLIADRLLDLLILYRDDENVISMIEDKARNELGINI